MKDAPPLLANIKKYRSRERRTIAMIFGGWYLEDVADVDVFIPQ